MTRKPADPGVQAIHDALDAGLEVTFLDRGGCRLVRATTATVGVEMHAQMDAGHVRSTHELHEVVAACTAQLLTHAGVAGDLTRMQHPPTEGQQP